MSQVSAIVIVPRISEGSPEGVAGTWIGAEGPLSARTLIAPFVQVGVNEFRQSERDQPARDYYYAFWSSTALGYHPHFLFRVQPKDAVQLSLTLVGGRWEVWAEDERTGSVKSLTSGIGHDAVFNEALWQQEDVSRNATEQFPYPRLSAVKFSDLKVNTTNPRSRALSMQWLSAGRRTFGPTAIVGNSFVIRRVHSSMALRHYQQIALRLDIPANAFNHDLRTWSRETNPATIRTICAAFARVLKQTGKSFSSYRWPAMGRALMTRLVAGTQQVREVVLRLARSPKDRLAKTVTLIVRDLGKLTKTSRQLKARLHWPVTEESTLAIAASSRTRLK